VPDAMKGLSKMFDYVREKLYIIAIIAPNNDIILSILLNFAIEQKYRKIVSR
jgi:hypothetical protein